MNNPEQEKSPGVMERMKQFVSNAGEALHIPSKERVEKVLVVGAATVAAFGASEISQNSEAEAGPSSPNAPVVSSYNVQASSLSIAGFKKCRKGKPAMQFRLIGPTPLKRMGRARDSYESEVPSIETPVKYTVKAKSCKKRKGVTFKMFSRSDQVTKRFNIKPNKVRNISYSLVFNAPDSDVTNPYRKGARKVSIALSQKDKPLGGAMINYLYSDSQLGAGVTPSVSEPTGPTGPTS